MVDDNDGAKYYSNLIKAEVGRLDELSAHFVHPQTGSLRSC